MGVSPNTFEHHNRMPRPGTRSRSPDRPVPFGDPIDSVRNSMVQGSMVGGSMIAGSMPGASIVGGTTTEKMDPKSSSRNSPTQMNTFKQSRVGSVHPDQIEPYMPTEPRQEHKLLMSNMQTETFG